MESPSTKLLTDFIFIIRGKRVILDFHLSTMYEVENRVLKQQVRRNQDRFPGDFMFVLTKKEWKELITNCDMLGQFKYSPIVPMAFTEQGVAMLSSVLRSKKAISVNIAIMRTFVKMREMMTEGSELKQRLDDLEKKYNGQFNIIFETIRQLIDEKSDQPAPIGFRIGKLKS